MPSGTDYDRARETRPDHPWEFFVRFDCAGKLTPRMQLRSVRDLVFLGSIPYCPRCIETRRPWEGKWYC